MGRFIYLRIKNLDGSALTHFSGLWATKLLIEIGHISLFNFKNIDVFLLIYVIIDPIAWCIFFFHLFESIFDQQISGWSLGLMKNLSESGFRVIVGYLVFDWEIL